MMTIVFGWGKTNIQQGFRKVEMNGMDDEQLEFMRNHPTKAIFDYQVSSAERYKHVNNEMFMNGSQDSDSHSPLVVYIRSKSATSKRSSERYQEYIKKKQSSWTPQEYKDYNKQWGHHFPLCPVHCFSFHFMSFISMHFPSFPDFPSPAWATSPASLSSSASLAGADADDAGDAGDVGQEMLRMQKRTRGESNTPTVPHRPRPEERI